MPPEFSFSDDGESDSDLPGSFGNLIESNAPLAEKLANNLKDLEDAEAELKNQRVRLMDRLESQPATQGMNREFVRLYSGVARVVFFTNPDIAFNENGTASVTQLAVSAKGFYKFSFSVDSETVKKFPESGLLVYINSPFEAEAIPDTDRNRDGTLADLVNLNHFLRTKLGNGLDANYEGDVLNVKNSAFEIGQTTYGQGVMVSHTGERIDEETATIIFARIQDRVGKILEAKNGELQEKIVKAHIGTEQIMAMIPEPQEEKPKNEDRSTKRRWFFGKS